MADCGAARTQVGASCSPLSMMPNVYVLLPSKLAAIFLTLLSTTLVNARTDISPAHISQYSRKYTRTPYGQSIHMKRPEPSIHHRYFTESEVHALNSNDACQLYKQHCSTSKSKSTKQQYFRAINQHQYNPFSFETKSSYQYNAFNGAGSQEKLQADMNFCGSPRSMARNQIKDAKISVHSACEVFFSRCKHPEMRFIEGDCKHLTACQKKRGFHLLSYIEDGAKEIWIPNCNVTSGAFAPLQCHTLIGYCWCVHPDNTRIRGTVRSMPTKPNCDGAVKQHTRMKRSQCSKSSSKWTQFRTHITKDIVYEYRATQQLLKLLESPANGVEAITSLDSRSEIRSQIAKTPDTIQWTEAIEWKFKELDKNNDERLSTRELSSFLKQMQKWGASRSLGVSGKSSTKEKADDACVQAFKDNCKQHMTFSQLQKKEWKTCLSDPRGAFYSLVAEKSPYGPNDDTFSSHQKAFQTSYRTKYTRPAYTPSRKKSTDAVERISEHNRRLNPVDKPSDPLNRQENIQTHMRRSRKKSSKKPEKPRISCTEEQKALRGRLFPESDTAANVIVPECTSDGSYKSIQCHKKSNYCWCVHPLTGRAITETSTKNGKPTRCFTGQSRNKSKSRYLSRHDNYRKYSNSATHNQIMNQVSFGAMWQGCHNGDKFIRKFTKVMTAVVKQKSSKRKNGGRSKSRSSRPKSTRRRKHRKRKPGSRKKPSKRKKSREPGSRRKKSSGARKSSKRRSKKNSRRLSRTFFQYMDSDGNGILEPKEQKKVKRVVRKSKQTHTKKCVRKFFDGHCDKNKDGVVDVREFSQCTYANFKRRRGKSKSGSFHREDDVSRWSWNTLQAG